MMIRGRGKRLQELRVSMSVRGGGIRVALVVKIRFNEGSSSWLVAHLRLLEIEEKVATCCHLKSGFGGCFILLSFSVSHPL